MTNLMNKIKLDGNVYDIVPHKLTDGSYTAEAPTLNQDGYVVASAFPCTIPAVPVDEGEFQLTFAVNGTTITPVWGYPPGVVLFTDTSDENKTKFVFIDSIRATATRRQLVYIIQ